MRHSTTGSLPLGRPRSETMGPETADVLNRFFPLYTPVLFFDGEPASPAEMVASGLQAFRAVYAYPTPELAREVGNRLGDAIDADHVEVWPVELTPETGFAVDERALGWLQWLDGYEFPVDQYRRPTMLRDGFVWPSVTQGIYALGRETGTGGMIGTSDLVDELLDAYRGYDPVTVRRRLDVLARRHAGQVLAGALRTLPQVLAGRVGGGSSDLHPVIIRMAEEADLDTEELVARLLPPLRLMDGYRVHQGEGPPPWLREMPRLEDYVAAMGAPDREARRRLIRSRMVTDLPLLPGELEEPQRLPTSTPKRRLPGNTGNRGGILPGSVRNPDHRIQYVRGLWENDVRQLFALVAIVSEVLRDTLIRVEQQHRLAGRLLPYEGMEIVIDAWWNAFRQGEFTEVQNIWGPIGQRIADQRRDLARRVSWTQDTQTRDRLAAMAGALDLFHRALTWAELAVDTRYPSPVGLTMWLGDAFDTLARLRGKRGWQGGWALDTINLHIQRRFPFREGLDPAVSGRRTVGDVTRDPALLAALNAYGLWHGRAAGITLEDELLHGWGEGLDDEPPGAFSGLYVTADRDYAARIAEARSATYGTDPVVHRITLLPGVDLALDEDMLGAVDAWDAWHNLDPWWHRGLELHPLIRDLLPEDTARKMIREYEGEDPGPDDELLGDWHELPLDRWGRELAFPALDTWLAASERTQPPNLVILNDRFEADPPIPRINPGQKWIAFPPAGTGSRRTR